MKRTDIFDDPDYCRDLSNAYFAEEEEMKAGIHPSQLIPKCKKYLREHGYNISLITFWDWAAGPGSSVLVTVGHQKVLVKYNDLPEPTEEEIEMFGYAM